MASAINWSHSLDLFDSWIRHLCHKLGLAWASLVLSSGTLTVPEFVSHPVPYIVTWLPSCVNTFNLVPASFAGLEIPLLLPQIFYSIISCIQDILKVHLMSSHFGVLFLLS